MSLYAAKKYLRKIRENDDNENNDNKRQRIITSDSSDSEEDTTEKLIQHGSSLFNIDRNQVITGNSTKFNCTVYKYNVTYSSQQRKTFGELTQEFISLFVKLHSDMMQLIKGRDKIRLLIEHSSFQRPISFSFLDKDGFMSINIQDSFFHVIQSFREVFVSSEDPLLFTVCLARLPNGGRSNKKRHPDMQSYRKNSPFITAVENNDNLCAIYSVFIAIAEYNLHYTQRKKLDKIKIQKYRNILNSNKLRNYSLLRKEADRFLNNFKINSDKKFGLEIFPLLQQYFNNEYQITVVSNIVD